MLVHSAAVFDLKNDVSDTVPVLGVVVAELLVSWIERRREGKSDVCRLYDMGDSVS
jgi:hypothetical protein